MTARKQPVGRTGNGSVTLDIYRVKCYNSVNTEFN